MKPYMGSTQDALHLEQLRKDYLAGEPGAGEQLGAALTRELRGSIRSSNADEVIQETLARAWTALPRFKPASPVAFRNWLYVIASRARSDLRQQNVAWISEAGRQPDPGPSPSRWMLERERERSLESAIGKLSSRLARLIAFVREGGKIKDFAALEGIPLRTAYSRNEEAQRKLRAMLGTWTGAQT